MIIILLSLVERGCGSYAWSTEQSQKSYFHSPEWLGIMIDDDLWVCCTNNFIKLSYTVSFIEVFFLSNGTVSAVYIGIWLFVYCWYIEWACWKYSALFGCVLQRIQVYLPFGSPAAALVQHAGQGIVATWLILPVVIRSSQRLSHARLSINLLLWNCEWLIISVIVYLIVPYYLDNRSNSRANTCVNTYLGGIY